MLNTSNPFMTKVLTSTTAIAFLAGVTFGLTPELDVFATGIDGLDDILEEVSLDIEIPSEEAQIAGDGYRVKFMNYDGEELYNEILPVGTFIEEPQIPERMGFTFLGWAPEVDVTVPEQDVVYTAQFVETDGGYADEEVQTDEDESVVVYNKDSNSSSDSMFASGDGDFTNFLFMVILFLMETVWLHDRRSQQMRRYDAVMSMLDKE